MLLPDNGCRLSVAWTQFTKSFIDIDPSPVYICAPPKRIRQRCASSAAFSRFYTVSKIRFTYPLKRSKKTRKYFVELKVSHFQEALPVILRRPLASSLPPAKPPSW